MVGSCLTSMSVSPSSPSSSIGGVTPDLVNMGMGVTASAMVSESRNERLSQSHTGLARDERGRTGLGEMMRNQISNRLMIMSCA